MTSTVRDVWLVARAFAALPVGEDQAWSLAFFAGGDVDGGSQEVWSGVEALAGYVSILAVGVAGGRGRAVDLVGGDHGCGCSQRQQGSGTCKHLGLKEECDVLSLKWVLQ